MEYSLSKFNVVCGIDQSGKSIVFNTRTASMMEIEDKYKDSFLNKNTDFLKYLDKSEVDQLLDNGFILSNKVNELDLIKKTYWNNKINSKALHITVMTTLGCNFKCVYCFEKARSIKMEAKTQEAIIKYVRENINKYEAIHIDWYGGEPLLNIECIENISKKVIDICNKYNKQYVGTITTNGYELTPGVIKRLKELKVAHAQITIDGPKGIHDERRILRNGNGTFDSIIGNIKNAKEYFDVTMRVNVDKDTVNYVDELFKYMVDSNLKDVTMSIKGVVSADANPCEEKMLEAKKFANLVVEKTRVAISLGLKLDILSALEFPANRFCIVDLDSQFIISPDGFIYKCGEAYDESDPGRIGKIDDNGNFEIDEVRSSFWQKDPFEYEECRECNVLPLCMGGCQMKRKVKNYGWCNAELKNSLDDLIKLYYKTKL